MNRIIVVAAAFAVLLTLTGAASVHRENAVLGPHGYKTLALGQSEAEAEATGLLVQKEPGPCDRYRLHPDEGQANPGSGVFIDPELGVVVIGGTTKSHTPEGSTIGSTFDEVRAAYPELTPVPPTDFVYRTPVPGHEDIFYRFAFDEAGKVSDFALAAGDKGTCAS